MMLKRLSVIAAVVISCSTASFAQSGTPSRIRGTIDAVDGGTLAVTARDGTKYALTLDPKAVVIEILPAEITDIKNGSFVGSAAMPQADGTLKALEVQIFPEAMRGTGEGTRAWDLQPGSTMTNATAFDVVGTDGRTLTLKYKDGEKKLVVPPNVPIITYGPGTLAMLKPGAHANFNVTRGPGDAYVTDRIQVGKDGLVPPT